MTFSPTEPTSSPGTAGVIRGDEAQVLIKGPLGADLLAGSEATGGDLAVVVHPLAPRTLGSPIHTHRHEDEYSFVLEGEVGVQIGDEVLTAGPGDLVCKPRGVAHAFWNASDEPARLLEIISPGGFEEYFAQLGELFATPGPPDLEAVGAIASRFGLEVDAASVPRLAETYGLELS